MSSAYVLTPNAVARRQHVLDVAERAEHARRSRAVRRKAVVVGVPLALLASVVGLTLTGTVDRLAAPAEEVRLDRPAQPLPPSAMIARVAPRDTGAVDEPDVSSAPRQTASVAEPRRRPNRASGRAGGSMLIERETPDRTIPGPRLGGDGTDDSATLPDDRRDQLAALDAIRELRLR